MISFRRMNYKSFKIMTSEIEKLAGRLDLLAVMEKFQIICAIDDF